MEKFSKQSFEEFVISADFVNVCTVLDEVVQTITSVSALDGSGEDASDTVLDASNAAIDGTKINVLVKGGDSLLSPYKITFRCVTSEGNKWELDVSMIINEA